MSWYNVCATTFDRSGGIQKQRSVTTISFNKAREEAERAKQRGYATVSITRYDGAIKRESAAEIVYWTKSTGQETHITPQKEE